MRAATRSHTSYLGLGDDTGIRRTSPSAPKHRTMSKKILESSAVPVWSPSKNIESEKMAW